ncbi:MAG: dihydroxy-acid dehydratase [Clostridia bacterium]|nr:dihydroxy-acid dehydratase [Clostridia bacterium]
MLRESIEQLNKLPQKIFAESVQIDAKKLTIGIICAQSETTLAHQNLVTICQKVKEGVLQQGATCKLMYISSIDDTLLRDTNTGKYSLPSRDLTANQVEMLCATECFDGLVFVASQPNTICGMLLGAIRVNIPCAFVSQGVMSPIVFAEKEYGYTHYAEQIALLKLGKTPYESLQEIENNLPTAFGTDCDSYSDNSFNCLLEIMGLAVKGNATTQANTVARNNIATRTGELAVALTQNKCTPRRVITQSVLENLVKIDLACGGSTTTLMNLIAIAKELSIKNITLKDIGDMAKATPLLLVKENENLCLMKQFAQAGGPLAVAKRLNDGKLINSKVELADGVLLQDVLQNITVTCEEVICSVENAPMTQSPLQVVYGNVAEGGAFARYHNDKVFSGVAKVYANEEMAVEAILCREINKGDVVVIRNEGPTSCPGMREIILPFALLKGYGLDKDVAVITDGRISDCYDGFAVGHVTPETNFQTVFTVLQDGDPIEINITKGKVVCDIKAKELQQRLRHVDGQIGNYASPYLKSWAKTCDTASNGCVTVRK